METNQVDTTALETAFRDAIVPGKFVRIEYLTDLSEFIKTDALLKRHFEQDGAEYLELGHGELVPLNRVISISGKLSPNFPGYTNYSCDC
ncbi:hypothetical protein [Spirosoma rhododendri]|uniref:Uncharacterized protein n=1 Tax=Spirosoma rhododendri TaxID=2728024 RepID=A0A7L5DI29_9BACT|nr:hypothetical protein [Spirosoma rhododendri]QJD78006.1 hypothetical protein HH216_05910 [Spirosoma rhododendri]